MPRMNIPNAVEREAFDSPPVFNSFQRKQYFDFPSKLRRLVAGLPQSGLAEACKLLGEYDFSDEKLRDSIGIRPPKLVD